MLSAIVGRLNSMTIRFDRLRYTLLTPGLQIPDEIYINLDGDYFLYHKEHPPSPLFLSRKDYRPIGQQTLDYYADCFAFLHDQPSLIIHEADRRSKPKPVLGDRYATTELNEKYYSSIYDIYRRILDKRLNGSVLFFNEEALDRVVSIGLHHFKKVPTELRLYNAALKQSEPYIEFFMYCRVLETICNGLNKNWIGKAIGQIDGYDFQPIAVFSNRDDVRDDKKINYIGLLLRRFRARVRNLRSQDIEIGDYYLDRIRNSIAHGNCASFELASIRGLEEDCIVMKLLCRFGIQKKYRSSRVLL
jgi:hypothetical protein